jgi:alpha-tubulin suppressor-like RCC1 family protein
MTAISAGDYYSLILSSQGQVYSFGYNDCGQLGLGDRENRDIPTLISLGSRNNDPIVAISAGCHHSLILTSRGQVYSFGRGEYGQLGTGFISNQVIPSPILNQNIGIIVALAAGESQSLILNSQGQVYSFGDNPNGELGLKYGGIGTHLPTLIETVEGLDGQEPIGFIMAMAAGEHHSFLLDSRGRVFSFGINHSGQLGLGDKMCRFTPTLVRNLTSG